MAKSSTRPVATMASRSLRRAAKTMVRSREAAANASVAAGVGTIVRGADELEAGDDVGADDDADVDGGAAAAGGACREFIKLFGFAFALSFSSNDEKRASRPSRSLASVQNSR